MKVLFALAALLSAAFVTVTPASAHHCWSQCDANGSGHCETFCE
jgi:hypothetical protein